MTVSDLSFEPEKITELAAQKFSDKYLNSSKAVYVRDFIRAMIQCTNDEEEYNDLSNDSYMVECFAYLYDRDTEHPRADSVFDLLVAWRDNYIQTIKDVQAGIV